MSAKPFQLSDVINVQPAIPPLSAPAVKPTSKASFNLSDVANVEGDKAPASFSLSDVSKVELAPGVYTPDVLTSKTDEDLLKDVHFDPARFAREHEQELTQNPDLQKRVLGLYKERSKRGTTWKQDVKALVTGLGAFPKMVGEGVAQLGKTAAPLLSGILPGDFTTPQEISKAGAETAASADTAFQSEKDLLRRGAREAKEGLGKILPGVNSKAEMTDADWLARLQNDVAGQRKVEEATKGNGWLAKQLDVDADTLAKEGIQLDPEAIQKLSLFTDPVNFIPVGAAVGVVGKVGSKAAKFALAATGTEAQAAKLAEILNAGAQASQKAVGGALKAGGDAVTSVGEAAEKGVRAIGGTAAGVGLGAVLGKDVYSALGGALAAKAAPRVVQGVGRAVSSAGEVIAGGKAATPAMRLVGDTLSGAAKGAAEGSALVLPFYIGATPEEREDFVGMASFGGVMRGAIEGATPGINAAGHGTQNVLAKQIFKTVESQAPEGGSPSYGRDHDLDAVHEQAIKNLPPAEQNLTNAIRESLRKSGLEVYVVDGPTMKARTGYDALGHAVDIGQRVDPSGNVTPVFQVLLKGDGAQLPHELFHALKALDPEKANAFVESVNAKMTPQERAEFKAFYERAIDPTGKYKLSDSKVSEEAAAEIFGRVLASQDLSGVEPSVMQKAALWASSALEKVGFEVGDAGKSYLGLKPKTQDITTGQAWIKDMAQRLDEKGVLNEPGDKSAISAPASSRPGTVKGIPADIITRKPEAAKPTPPPAETIPAKPGEQLDLGLKPAEPKPTPPPAETAPVAEAGSVTPKLPESAPNIRVDKSNQEDFATRQASARAEVTNNAEARAAAVKLNDPKVTKTVEEISNHIEEGRPVLEIEHQSANTEKANQGRDSRRAEQEAAYIAEGLGAAPADIRTAYQKVFVPQRWEIVAGKPQLLAMSLDKVIANTHRLTKSAAEHKVESMVPYEIVDGKLTDNGWGQFVDDLKSYAANQANGFRGDGKPLVRPNADIGLSIPSENKAYSPVQLTEERANFLNAVMGLNPPKTAREMGKSMPGNVKGQILGEINKRQPEAPAKIDPNDIEKQTFKSYPDRNVAEMNPLRNELSKAGVPVRDLIEVTERIRPQDVNSVKARPELNFKAPVTDTIRGGFSPEVKERRTDAKPTFIEPNEEVRNIAGTYAKGVVSDYKPHQNYDEIPKDAARKLADFYETAKSDPNDPEVKASYKALADETLSQLKAVTDAGYTVEPYREGGEPYKSSADMVKDVEQNKHLYYLPTEGNIKAKSDNPLLAPTGIESVPTVNDAFRAVHDFFGHAKEGYQFGPRGEYNSWKSHSAMYSDAAQGALAAETLAQNSWVNFGKHLRDAKGEVIKKGEPGHVEAANRPFAEQKNTVVPKELINEARGDFSPARKALPENFNERTETVLKATPEEFRGMFEGGRLTQTAYETGLNLKSKVELDRLVTARDEATAKFRDAMTKGDFDAGSVEAVKSQFFREAYEAATDTGSAAGKQGWRREFPDREAPFAHDTGSFSPMTESGKKFRDFGYDFNYEDNSGLKMLAVTRGGKQVGHISSTVNGDKAKIALSVLEQGHRGKGLGEAMYRELLTRLKDAGVKEVSGDMVDPAPIAIRKNIFGGIEDLRHNDVPVDIDTAMQVAKNLKSSYKAELISGKNTITAESHFSPDLKKAREEYGLDKLVTKDEAKSINWEHVGKLVSPELLKESGVKSVDFTITNSLHDPQSSLSAHFDDTGRYPVTAEGLAAAEKAGRDFEAEHFRLNNHRPSDSDFTPGDFAPKAPTAAVLPQFAAKKPLENSVDGPLSLIRFSSLSGESVAHPKNFGKGKATPTDRRGMDKVYFYEEGSPLGGDENIFQGTHAYNATVDGSRIYDVDNGDPLKWRSTINREEADQNLLDEGYVGLRVTTADDRKVVAIFKPVKVSAAGKLPESSAKAVAGDFLPKKNTEDDLLGLGLPSKLEARREVIARRVEAKTEQYPEARPVEYQLNRLGKFVIDEETNKPKPVQYTYDLADSALAKEEGDNYTSALADKLVSYAKKAKKDPTIEAGETWYSEARTRLKKLLGDDSKLFAELLAATSAQTPVEQNFIYSTEAYNKFKAGDYDGILKKYREGKAKWSKADIADFFEENTNVEDPSRGQFLDWWIEKHYLGPRRDNGKKYSANSRAVLRVLDGTWLEDVKGPKTKQFMENLLGVSFGATIDVWAARALHRLSNEEKGTRWRILPENETGVKDEDFALGQEAFAKAAKQLKMKPDALQALLWFAEKDHWQKKGWTRGAGAEKSDFNVMFKKTVKTPNDRLEIEKKPDNQLDFGIAPEDIIRK